MATENKQPDLISHHVFFFPFKWELLGKNQNFAQRHSLKGSAKRLGPHWRKSTFRLETIVNRNEYNYFYDFVREVIYDLDQSPLEQDRGNRSYLDHYSYAPAENKGQYLITIPRIPRSDTNECFDKQYDYGQGRWVDVPVKMDQAGNWPDIVYALEIDSILLHLYATGVGVLSFHLNNREYPNPEDILRINQYGRRIFPPFYGIPAEHIGYQTGFEFRDFAQGLALARGNEIAASIELRDVGEHLIEDFEHYATAEYTAQSFSLPRFIRQLLPNLDIRYDKKDHWGFFVSPVLDDRMFVLCWYGNDQLINQLTAEDGFEKTQYTESDFWYEYAFVDKPGGKSCQHRGLAAQQVQAATNVRWSGYGTWYANTPYSMVALTGSLAHLRKPDIGAAFLVTHMQTLYAKLTELVLMQKACLLKFSDEITCLSNLPDSDHQIKEANALYLDYLKFINKIYFREVTAQTQGIELYNALQQQLCIERDVGGLSQEMAELHNYVMLQKQMEQQVTAENLTKIATYLLPPTLLAALLGLSTIDDNFQFYGGAPHGKFWTSLLVIVVVSAIAIYFIYKLIINRKHK